MYHHIFHKMKMNERLFISPAAVSASETMMKMWVLEGYGQSSSISKPVVPIRKSGVFNASAAPVHEIDVPVLSLRDILEAVPPSVELWLVKIDTQGNDFTALKAAGAALRRAQYVKSEVWLHGQVSYADVDNDFCADHLPLMTKRGFELQTLVHEDTPWTPLARGKHEAKVYCTNEDRSQQGNPGGFKDKRGRRHEANAFWRRSNVTLAIPPLDQQAVHAFSRQCFFWPGKSREYSNCLNSTYMLR